MDLSEISGDVSPDSVHVGTSLPLSAVVTEDGRDVQPVHVEPLMVLAREPTDAKIYRRFLAREGWLSPARTDTYLNGGICWADRIFDQHRRLLHSRWSAHILARVPGSHRRCRWSALRLPQASRLTFPILQTYGYKNVHPSAWSVSRCMTATILLFPAYFVTHSRPDQSLHLPAERILKVVCSVNQCSYRAYGIFGHHTCRIHPRVPAQAASPSPWHASWRREGRGEGQG